MRGSVQRAGLRLCLTVAGLAVAALAASFSVEPVSRALLVAGAGAAALALALLTLRRLVHDLTVAMRPTDITNLRRREEDLSDRVARLHAALDTLSLGFLLYDRDHRLLVVNRRYHEIYRLPPGAVTPGMPALEVLRRNVITENLSDSSEAEQVAEIGALMGADAVPTQIQHLADGRVVAIEIQPIDGGGFVAIYEEATERWNAEARIAHMARHDAVTDLPNRVLLRERIEGAITQARRDTGFAVLCLDLDNFKQVNDTLG
uniref:sensor domain-containing diguanylate cyclase n=1 Tax=Methylorubrum podarium TaxID=200476 RepID=UPI001EE29571